MKSMKKILAWAMTVVILATNVDVIRAAEVEQEMSVCEENRQNVIEETEDGIDVSDNDATAGDVTEGDVSADDSADDSLITEPDYNAGITILHSGTISGVTWEITSDGILTIGGENTDMETSVCNSYPWHEYKEDYTKVVVNAKNVISTQAWFKGCDNITEIVFSSFDTSKVTNMVDMFSGCSSLTTLDLNSFNTSNVARMDGMFRGCSSLTELDLSSFDTSKVTDMGGMFKNCSSLTGLYLDGFNTSNVTYMSYMFDNCSSLPELDLSSFDTSKVRYMSEIFRNCCSLKELDLGGFNTEKITDMEYMFVDCKSLKKLDISSFDTTNVINMQRMFYNCSSLTELNLSSFDTSNVTNMYGMFSNCSSLKELDLSCFDTSNVTNMYAMFHNCSSLKKLNIKSFDTHNVTKMGVMFDGCSSLTELSLNNFDTSKVTLMDDMFYNCSSLKKLDVSSFNTCNVTTMSKMFDACSGLTKLDVSNFDTRNVTSMYCMFEGCSGLTTLDVNNFDTSKVTNMDSMFRNCSNLTEFDLSNFDLTGCESAAYLFPRCPSLTRVRVPAEFEQTKNLPFAVMYDINGVQYNQFPKGLEEPIWLYRYTYETSYVIASGELSGMTWEITSDGVLKISGTNTEYVPRSIYPWHEYSDYFSKVKVDAKDVANTACWFSNCDEIREIDFSNFDTSKVLNMAYMFYNCRQLTKLDLSNFDTSNVTTMHSMFDNCYNLEKLDISNFDTSNVTDMSSMFDSCHCLEELDVSNFDTSNVKTMREMFSWCYQLSELDLRAFDTSNITNMDSMFYNCNSLKKLKVSNFDTAKVSNFASMFAGCSGLEELDISGFKFQTSCNTKQMFDYCTNLKRTHFPGEVNIDLILPMEIMYDLNGTAYTQVPKGLTESIWLYKEVPNEAGKLRVTDVKPQTYTGKAIKPQIQVYIGNTLLIEKKDYTLSYRNNIKACNSADAKKAPTIVVKGKGNYTKSETVTFDIEAKNVADEDVTVNELVAVEGQKVQKPIPVLKYNGKKLVNKKDFTVSYPDLEDETKVDAYKVPGTYRVLITGKGNFTGTRELTFTITDGTLMSKTKIAKIANQNYTGAAIEPEIKVTKGKTELVKGRDYTVSYESNVEIGKATVVVSGMGEYAGTKTATFQIVGQSIAKAKVEGIEDKIYNGIEQGQDVTVTLTQKVQMEDGMQEVPVKLENGTDYQIAYVKNVNAGTATMIISGKGYYSGTIKKQFKIQPYDLQQDEDKLLSGIPENLVVSYEKGGCKPALNLSFAGTEMVAKTDYNISYKNNTKVADFTASKVPSIVVKGKGNFKGTITVPFSIMQKDFQDRQDSIVIKVADVPYSKNKGKFMSKPILMDCNGKKLTAGTDYEKKIIYMSEEGENLDNSCVVEAGKTITVLVTGKGAYKGTIETTYRVTPASFKKAKIKIEPQVYTGQAVTLEKEDIVVTMEGKKLVYGRDFIIVENSYQNNMKKGTASVTIKGKGNYGGEKKVKFKIAPKEFIWFWRLFR